MGLRGRLLAMPLEQRFSYDPTLRLLFIDFRELAIRSDDDVARIRTEVERRVAPLGHKVHAIANYRGCSIAPSVLASYRRMVESLEKTCYLGVTRYGASATEEPEPDSPDHAQAWLRAS
jgi:propionate CoA-transferase